MEEERWEWVQKRLFDTEYASVFLTNLKGQIEEKLAKRRHRSELVISHYRADSTLFTSEGTQIREITPQTEIIVYLLIKEGGQGYASKIFGGIGGFERIQEQPWCYLLTRHQPQ